MNINEQTDAFLFEMQGVVNKFKQEFDLNHATIVGCLETVKIVKTSEETFVKMELEMDDDTHAMLVQWGKDEASDEDYVGIAVRCGLDEYLDKEKDA